jgi:hypothetical protein
MKARRSSALTSGCALPAARCPADSTRALATAARRNIPAFADVDPR